MSENTSRTLLEEANNTVSEKTEDQRNAPTFIEITDENKSNFIENMKNKNTVGKTQSAVKQSTTWLQMIPRFETREINKIPPGELDNFVGSFLLSIRKADGSEYEPDTLTSYHRSIDRFLKEKKYLYSLVNDQEFETSRAVLQSKRKELKQKGKGCTPNAATISEENKIKGYTQPKDIIKQKMVTKHNALWNSWGY